jgi:hypothetical protein
MRLHQEIEDEYDRLAHEHRRLVQTTRKSRLSRWLGLRYLAGIDTSRVHSSTAFVQFKTLAAKQEAIQCNITGVNKLMVVEPVPDARSIIWRNAHVSRTFINARTTYVNVALVGLLVAWSFAVAGIRSYNDLSIVFHAKKSYFKVFFDVYVPALIVEGLVRIIPLILKSICVWIRFKAQSEIDLYIVRWYFGFRLVTFVFVIVGESIAKSGADFVDDPMYVKYNLISYRTLMRALFLHCAFLLSEGSSLRCLRML